MPFIKPLGDTLDGNLTTTNKTFTGAINELDSDIGDKTYDYNEIVTDGESLTASINKITTYLHNEDYSEYRYYPSWQNITKQSGVLNYNITQDENSNSPYIISDYTSISNDILDFEIINPSTRKAIFKQGSILPISSNRVKVINYNNTTGVITLNFEPKENFRVVFLMKYTNKDLPNGKKIEAENGEVIISNTDEASEITYSNLTSLINASTVQDSIDVLAKGADTIRYVSKNGSNSNNGKTWSTAFLTIQYAINSITDASSSKPYTIYVDNGEYNENIIAKDNVQLLGANTTLGVLIYSSTAPVLTCPNGTFVSGHIDYELRNPTVSGGYTIDATAGAGNPNSIVEIKNTNTKARINQNGIYAGLIKANCGELRVLRSDLNIINSATGTMNNNYNIMEINGSTLFIGEAIAIYGQFAYQGSGNTTYFNFNTSGLTLATTTVFNFIFTNALYTGKASAVKYTSGSTNSQTVSNQTLNVIGSGGGIGSAFSIDSNSSITSDINASSINVTGFATNYIGETFKANNTLNLNFVPTSSVGLFNQVLGRINYNILQSGYFKTNVGIIDTKIPIGNSTKQTLQDMFNIGFSAGWVSGGEITNNGNGTVNITSGYGFIRESNSDQAQLRMFDWSASNNISITNNSSNYIYIDYNSGSPIVSVTIIESDVYDNENSKFELYEIYREGTVLHITPHKQRALNGLGETQKYLYDLFPLRRARGLLLGESGNGSRNITTTAGRVYVKINKIDINAINTATGGNFDRYYLTGTTTWVKTTGNTTWDNTNYNTILTGLSVMTNNKYSFQDFYIDADGDLVSIYATNEYTSQASAETAPLPLTPPRLSSHSVYIGRIVFQKAGTTALSVLSPFTGQVLSGTSVNNHNALSNLQGGTTGEYYHLTSNEYTTQFKDKSTTVTINTSLDNTYKRVYCNNSGNITITLPNATTYPDIVYSITNINTGTTTINTVASQTINGFTSRSISAIYGTFTIQSVGSQWVVLTTNSFGGV